MNFNYLLMFKVTSIVTLLLGVSMIPSLAIAISCGETYAAFSLFLVMIICIFVGTFFTVQTHERKINMKSSEGYFITFICWAMACLIGSLPFLFANCGYSFINCFFESTSGFTTTGCSVIPIDDLPKSLLFWKATTHWLGGMGILILMVAIFPFLGISGQTMAEAEAPGPTLEKTATRMADTGKFLYGSYILFSIVELIMLLFSGMSLYDALINTMSSISTGGLLITDANSSFFSTSYVQFVILLFSVLSSINYMTYFFIAKKDPRGLKKNVELKCYLLIIVLSALLISGSLIITGCYDSIPNALRDGLNHSVAASSTSGYALTDYNSWPTFARFVMFVQMLIGSCASSTGGSIKVMRFIVFLKLVGRGFYRRVHPRSVRPVIVGGRIISAQNAASITMFVMLYFAIFLFSCLFISIDNLDMETTVTTVLSIFSNAGMSFGEVGISCDYSIYSPLCRAYLSILMIAGRLEMYSVIFLFSRSFWNQDKANY